MSVSNKIEMHSSGAVVCFLSGKLIDENVLADFQVSIEDQIHAGKKKFVLVLTQVAYINSSGLNWIIRLFTKVRNSGGELVLCGVNESVNNILAIAKLNSIFNIQADIDSAINHFNAPEA